MNLFDRIRESQKTGGGWLKKDHAIWHMCVLTGELAGTWTKIPQGRWRYEPELRDLVYTTKMLGVQKWRMAKIAEVKGGLTDAAYVCGQIAGVDLQKALAEEPRRLLTLKEVKDLPSHFRDRVRFCKVLCGTWSYQAALKAIMPNVAPANRSLVLMQSLPRIRQILSGYKLAMTRETVVDLGVLTQQGQTWTPKEFKSLLASGWLRPDAHYGFDKKTTEMMDAWKMAQEERGGVLPGAPMPEIVLRATEYKTLGNWRELCALHHILTQRLNIRVAEARVRYEAEVAAWRAQDPEYWARAKKYEEERAALLKKVRSQEFNLPSGVRQLKTAAEFQQEGQEMQHCVATYWEDPVNIFAFNCEGDRGTLELSADGVVLQFRSWKNRPVSSKMQELKQIFLDLNKAE